MGRPAKEPFLSLRVGNVELVVQVVAPTKRQALDMRPSADLWVENASNVDAVYGSVEPWLQRVAAIVEERNKEPTRQQPLPFREP